MASVRECVSGSGSAVTEVRCGRADSGDRADDQRVGGRDLGSCSRPARSDRFLSAVDGLWRNGLLRSRSERGSAPVEAIFAIIFIIVLVLGAIQVAFVLYGRNVVASSAHEAARALIELEADPAHAEVTARTTVTRATGELVGDLRVTAAVATTGETATATVTVSGVLRPLGLLPISVPVTSTASTSRETAP
jgi:TadE-like protein